MSKTLVAPPSEIKAFLRLVVTDPDGKVLSDTEQESHSFVIQFLEMLYAFMSATAYTSTDTSNVEKTIFTAASVSFLGQVVAAIYNDDFGTVVGTGNTAETNLDYKLETQLTEGTAAGNITHNQCTINAVPAVVGANVDMLIIRSFTNNTGAVITVKEAGIYAKNSITTNHYHMHCRDVLVSATDVPDKCSLTIWYTYRTAV